MPVMHGEDDESVPVTEVRQLAGAHSAAKLSLLPRAEARLRYDPLAVAILMGCLQQVQPVRPERSVRVVPQHDLTLDPADCIIDGLNPVCELGETSKSPSRTLE